MPNGSPSLPATRQAAIQWYTKELTRAAALGDDDHYETRRWLARNDLFYLLVAELNRPDVNRDWLYDRCREVQAAPDEYLDLWAREHYKSTIITFALTIQEIINDPEITVGIFSHTRTIAKGFLRHIKRELEANNELKALFPEVFYGEPQRFSPKWSENEGLIVKRRGNPREATIEAWGLVDGQPTSKHFRLMVYDDVVTRESVSTPDMIRTVTSAWELSRNLGTEDGRARYAGTRYHFADTYHEIMRRGVVKARIHTATVDGTVDGEPVLMSRGKLAEKRREMGPYTFGCQMLLDPKADEAQGFKEDWLTYWTAKHTENLTTYILVDPAGKKTKDSDYTFMGVVGFGADRVYRVITMIRDRLSLTERADALFDLHKEYRPLGVGYEEYGLQADIEHMQDRMERENYHFRITPLGGKLGKEDRIRRMVPIFEQGRMLLPETCNKKNREGVIEDLTQVFIDEEYLPFPVGAHDDMLDGLARIFDLGIDAAAVFPVPIDEVLIDPFKIPGSWPKCYALYPGRERMAALWAAHDKETDTVYLYAEHYRRQAEPSIHATAIKARGDWIPGVIGPWMKGRPERDAKQIVEDYRSLGLNLELANNAFDAGVQVVWERLSVGRLKAFRTLQNFQAEYRRYRRDGDGKVVCEDDDLMNCTRFIMAPATSTKDRTSGLHRAIVKPTPMSSGMFSATAGDSTVGY